jgi:hypothetical protein
MVSRRKRSKYEYRFDSLADFETSLAGMAAPRFKAHSDALMPYVVPGSQHWVIYRVLDEAPGDVAERSARA